MSPLLSVDLLRHPGIEHQDCPLPARDVEPHQGAVLGVQVGPDLEILGGIPVKGMILILVYVLTLCLSKPSGLRTLISKNVSNERITRRTRYLGIGKSIGLLNII